MDSAMAIQTSPEEQHCRLDDENRPFRLCEDESDLMRTATKETNLLQLLAGRIH